MNEIKEEKYNMLIILEDSGRLCNKLFLLCHCIASSREYGFKVKIYTFSSYREYFLLEDEDEMRNVIILKNRLYTRVVIKIFKFLKKLRITKYMNVFDESNTTREFINLKLESNELNHKNYIVLNWLFRDDVSFIKQMPYLKKIFRPKESYYKKSINNISLLRENYDMIIGVHIRRGDYALWENGVYCFDDATFVNWMLQLSEQMKNDNKKIVFYLTSDEVINADIFKKNSLNIELGTGHFIEDLYSLSLCDYIFGPPSTYSLWAAMYGGIKYCHVNNRSQKLMLENFMNY